MTPTSHLCTVAQVAERFNVSKPTVRRWITSGLVRAVQTPGGSYRIPQEEVDRALAEWHPVIQGGAA